MTECQTCHGTGFVDSGMMTDTIKAKTGFLKLDKSKSKSKPIQMRCPRCSALSPNSLLNLLDNTPFRQWSHFTSSCMRQGKAMSDHNELILRLIEAVHSDCSWWRRDKWCAVIGCKCQLAQTLKEQMSLKRTQETGE